MAQGSSMYLFSCQLFSVTFKGGPSVDENEPWAPHLFAYLAWGSFRFQEPWGYAEQSQVQKSPETWDFSPGRIFGK